MIYRGIPASPGYALGTVQIMEEPELIIEQGPVGSPVREKQRLARAVAEANRQLRIIREKTLRETGEEQAKIFDTHLMFLEDPEFMGEVEAVIEDRRISSMQALSEVAHRFIELFESLEDEYMRERAADVRDVSRRILHILAGTRLSIEIDQSETVVVAHDLTPSDTASLDKDKVIAFVTNVGGRTSHTAIMARTLEIPAVVGLGDISDKVSNGDLLMVDGVRGEVLVNPPDEIISDFKARREAFRQERTALKRLAEVKTTSRDGKPIEVLANIGRLEDVDSVIANGGEGIGLFRAEFLYMNREELPTEEELYAGYRQVLERMAPKPVIIRTLDIGGDKQLPYLSMPVESNPFLGYRAIRLCLDQPDLFKTQLRALLRASVHGNLKVMFPMISGVGEVRSAMALVRQCEAELKDQGYPVAAGIQWGVTVEVPSAAVIADDLAREVDFLSIGTNDLIQYTLAADRMSEKVSYLYDPMHPAVLRLIQMTIDGAHAHGKTCGMCGEMAGDETMIPILLAMGLDEFSMSSSAILKARQIILDNDSDQAVKDPGQVQ